MSVAEGSSSGDGESVEADERRRDNLGQGGGRTVDHAARDRTGATAGEAPARQRFKLWICKDTAGEWFLKREGAGGAGSGSMEEEESGSMDLPARGGGSNHSNAGRRSKRQRE